MTPLKLKKNFCHRLTLTAGLLAAAQLQAQTQTPAPALGEVVVSASRAEQRSFDAPASVQSVGRETIENAGPQVNLSESLRRVPGLTILNRENYAQDLQVSIRGFGARSAFGIRGIRLLVDGIPATTPDGQGQGSSISLTSIDRIEVLRGPLAQLYGNSAGGVIQAFTREAAAEPEVDFKYYTGSYGLRRADYQISGRAGIYGIVADYSTFSTDGYRANSQAERKQFNGKISFDANEQMQVNLVFNQFDMPQAQDPLGLSASQLAANPQQAGTNALGSKNATDYRVRKTVLQNQLGSSATYKIDADRSITGRLYAGTRSNLQYQAGNDISGSPTRDGAWTGLERNYYGAGLQYNLSTRLNNTPVSWAAGYEFDLSKENRQSGAARLGEKTSTTRNEDNQAENSDFFVQANAAVAENLSVVTGLRYSSVKFSSQDFYLSDGDGSGNVAFHAANPVLGFSLHASDKLNLYANYGKGFETPTLAESAFIAGPNNTALGRFNQNLNASTSQHYEIGLKWIPAPQARVDLAYYQINTTDELVVASNSSGRSAYKNAPGTSRSGWELGSSAQLSNHFMLTASASAIDAHYAQGFTGAAGSAAVASGNKMPGIPQTSLFTELVWTSQAAAQTPKTAAQKFAAKGLRLGLEVIESGRIYANDSNTESAPGYALFNLSASHGWQLGKGMLTLYARLNNVNDKRYVGSVIVNQAAAQYYEPGLPRNWTLGVSAAMPL